MISLDKFTAKLDELYLRQNISALYDELFTIEQAIGESTSDYYERFITLLSELLDGADIPRDVAVNWLCNGLLDILKEKVTYRRHADSVLDSYAENKPEEAVNRCFKIASAEEAMLLSSSRAFLLNRRTASLSSGKTVASSTARNEARTYTTGQVTQPTAWRAPAERQPSVATSGSSNANRRINSSREDDKKKVLGPMCFKCRERGHIAKECEALKKLRLNNMFAPLNEAESDEETTTVRSNDSKN